MYLQKYENKINDFLNDIITFFRSVASKAMLSLIIMLTCFMCGNVALYMNCTISVQHMRDTLFMSQSKTHLETG